MNFRDLIDWISGRASEKKSAQAPSAQERRRHLRLDLSGGEVMIGKQGPYPLANLSYGGLRFCCNRLADFPGILSGALFEATICLGQVQLSTKLKACNLTPQEIGCAFELLSPAHARLLGDFLKPRILGSSLKEITGGTMRNESPDLRLRWFQGEEDTQIYLWETLEGNIVKEEFYFFDYLIRFDASRSSLQTGSRREKEGKLGYGRIDQSAVAFFQVPSHRALKIGRLILESANLPPAARDHLLACITREERRLYQRYMSSSVGGLRFLLDQPELKPLTVANLSLTGIAFLVNEETSGEASSTESRDIGQTGVGDDISAGTGAGIRASPNPVRGELSGTLELGQNRLPALVRLIYHHREVLGGSLHLLNEADMEILAAFLAPRLLGQSLEELPPPSEEYPFAPPGARSYLFVGFHNTHLLALIGSGRRLVTGRIAFMDRLLTFERGKLSAWHSEQGVVFPSDWELPLETVKRLDQPPVELVEICRCILTEAKIPEEVREAWIKALTPPSPPSS
ncbi:MAG: hypothetical protein WA705_25375 [Candidatus Ozemobacteraceae bacterium]